MVFRILFRNNKNVNNFKDGKRVDDEQCHEPCFFPASRGAPQGHSFPRERPRGNKNKKEKIVLEERFEHGFYCIRDKSIPQQSSSSEGPPPFERTGIGAISSTMTRHSAPRPTKLCG